MWEDKKTSEYLIKNSFNISMFRGLGIITGWILDAVVLAHFGLGIQTDAFLAAYALPFFIISILESQIPKVLVPICIHTMEKEGKDSGWQLVSLLLNAIGFISIIIGVIGILIAKILIPIQVPGLKPESLQMSIQLAKILFWLPVFALMTDILISVLNAFHKYAIPAATKLITNILALTSVLLLSAKFGIFSLAYGFLLGRSVNFFILLLMSFRNGFTYQPNLSFRDSKLLEAGKLMLYPLIGQGISSCREFLENFLASFMPPGSISAVRYASKIVVSFSGILAGTIIIPTLPLISTFTANHDIKKMKYTLKKSIRILALLTFPLSIWLALMSQPMVSLIFERGNFAANDTQLTASLIILMVPYIFLSRLIGIFEIPFYASKDTRTPIISMVSSLFTDITILFLLISHIGVYSIPIANMAASIAGTGVMIWLFLRRFGNICQLRLKGFPAQLLVAICMMTLGLLFGSFIIMPLNNYSFLNKSFKLFIPSALGGLFFLSIIILLEIDEVKELKSLFGLNKTSITKSTNL